jgi:hypothetical protein
VEVLVGQNWPVLIPIAALVVFVVGANAVLRMQKRTSRAQSALSSGATGFNQSRGESREEFVRRNWQRSGVVANGATLVDLYDRIRALEERVERAERNSAVPPTD